MTLLDSPLESSAVLSTPLLLPILYPSCESRGRAKPGNMPPTLAKTVRCPVEGCGKRKEEWGKKSYLLPSPDIFTLKLIPDINVVVNDRICQPCWKRHKDPTMGLDGRERKAPPTPLPSPLDALLAALSPLPSSSTSSSSSSTSPSTLSPASSHLFSPPTPARVITFDPPVLPTTIISTPLRRTHSSPPVLDLSPPPSTYSERQRDVVASVMAGID